MWGVVSPLNEDYMRERLALPHSALPHSALPHSALLLHGIPRELFAEDLGYGNRALVGAVDGNLTAVSFGKDGIGAVAEKPEAGGERGASPVRDPDGDIHQVVEAGGEKIVAVIGGADRKAVDRLECHRIGKADRTVHLGLGNLEEPDIRAVIDDPGGIAVDLDLIRS